MSAKFLFLAFASVLAVNCRAANILIIPFFNASHFLEMNGVGRPLAERGHNVYVLLDETLRLPKGLHYPLVTHKNVRSLDSSFDSKTEHSLFKAGGGQDLAVFEKLLKDVCVNMLSDKDLFPKLQKLHIDLVLVDNFFTPCFFIVPYKLGVPYVSVGSVVTAWYSRLPVLPSVVKPILGLDFFGVHFCEETDNQNKFIRRVCRVAAHFMQEAFFNFFDSEYLREYAEYPSVQAIRENASLSLFNLNFLLSGQLPKLPHVEFVGGLTTRPAKPLEPGLQQWMDLAANVVVVSFGSRLGSLPPNIASKLFDAFGRVNDYRFLFRFRKSDSLAYTIPSNVRIMDWLPQNDALGHKSTRLFVTHSGNNGQNEALYHGVPMLCFYIMGDQVTNAVRVTKKGFGKMSDVNNFTVEQLVADLIELLQNKTYSERIKKASAIFHSEKHPSERAADAVEHVLKYGGEHLRPKEAYKLTWWQFYMLDVLAVIYLAFVVTIVVSWKLALYIGRRVLSRARPSKKAKSD